MALRNHLIHFDELIDLQNSRLRGLNEEFDKDIGIMTVTRQQVVHIRTLLRKAKLGAVNVGTVEDYQGMERKVILLLEKY